MSVKIQLLIIDPQNDFCDPNGSLFVPGSVEDMDRLSLMVSKLKNKIYHVHVSLDNHHPIDIAHAVWFVDGDGNHPAPFTQIKTSDLLNGVWRANCDVDQDETLKYLDILEESGRYPHVIWPTHCLIGSEGSNVVPIVQDALLNWATDTNNWVNFITKGANPWTEHFSAVMAEVPDPYDESTQLNVPLISDLEEADVILLAGEAGSHCLANTVIDIANNSDCAKKMVLLKDTTSPVPSFEAFQDKFITEMVGRGMKVSTTTDFVKSI
jgi:nicotinamidase/pyrazinamidase